jgi:hypothetical protein
MQTVTDLQTVATVIFLKWVHTLSVLRWIEQALKALQRTGVTWLPTVRWRTNSVSGKVRKHWHCWLQRSTVKGARWTIHLHTHRHTHTMLLLFHGYNHWTKDHWQKSMTPCAWVVFLLCDLTPSYASFSWIICVIPVSWAPVWELHSESLFLFWHYLSSTDCTPMVCGAGIWTPAPKVIWA